MYRDLRRRGNPSWNLCWFARVVKASKQILPHTSASAGVARRMTTSSSFLINDSGGAAIMTVLTYRVVENRKNQRKTLAVYQEKPLGGH